MSNLELAVRPLRATVDAREFSEALKNISLVLKKSDVPILEEASIRFSGGRCILTTTDLTTWMIAEIPASGDDFSFIFSRTKKLELVCRRFDGSLTLEWTENTARHDGDGFVRLSCGSRTGEFDTWSTDLCPDIPKVDGDVSFSANAAELLERINRVAYATLKPGEGGRDASACVAFSGKQIYALDGYRAAWDDGELDFPQRFWPMRSRCVT